MVTDAYGSLLQELGKLLNIKNLQPDENNSCLIKFPNSVSIQIEPDRSGEFLTLGCDLGTVPPGSLRENVFREALKSNGQQPPREGDFAFTNRGDRLVFTKQLPIKELNGDKILLALTPFLEKAKYWHEALAKGEVPSSMQGAYASKGISGGGIFGLKP